MRETARPFRRERAGARVLDVATARRPAHGADADSLAAGRPPIRLVPWSVVGLGVLLTALVLSGAVDFEYRNAAAHLVLETINACVALLASYMVYGRFLRSRRLQDLVLMQGLLMLGVASSSMSVGLLAAVGDRSGRLDVWLPLAVRVVAAVFIAAAAVAGTSRLVRRVSPLWAVVVPVGVVASSVLILAASGSRLPLALDQEATPGTSLDSVFNGHPALMVAQLFTVACFVLAAALFTAQGRRTDDQLVQWLGPALALGALARLHYAFYPSLYSDWVSTGDVLRTAFYMVLLVGAVHEISAYWGAQARVAVIEDRRRLARELHDGVVQELGYIRAESGALRTVDPPRTERILGACDRALDEARQAVEVMGSSADEEPLGFTVHRAARQVADRFGLALELELNDTVMADQTQRHALLRIVREAVSNAARHGRAQAVKVEIQRLASGGCRLLVCDDGTGFDVSAATARRTGFGLTSMRERAEGLPGTFELESSPEDGTTIMVTW